MLCFYKSDRRSGEDTHRKPLIYLFAAGLVFGIGVSIKWTNLFAGLGLFAIFTVAFFRKRKDVIKKKHSLYTLITAGISFIFVSGLIYLLSYLPYLRVQSGNLFSVFFKNQEYMFQHHTMTEVYMDIGQSPWYQWPLNLRGYRRITPSQYMYYANNVALYGAGLFATVFVMVYTAMLWYSKNRPSRGMNNISDLKEKHKTEQGKGDSILFLLSGSLSAFIPWVFVSRKTFSRLYAYTVIFMIGFIVFTLREIYTIGQKNIKLRKEKVTIQGVGSIICAILLLVFIFNFLLMLPVFLGIPISRTYAALLGIV
jgi:dolichyl-phosphate-mannose--protein O-mannosyl transferase